MTFFAILLLVILLFFVIAAGFATDCRCAGPDEGLPEEVCGLADGAALLEVEDGDSADGDLDAVAKSGRFNVSALEYLNVVLNVGFIPFVVPFLSIW